MRRASRLLRRLHRLRASTRAVVGVFAVLAVQSANALQIIPSANEAGVLLQGDFDSGDAARFELWLQQRAATTPLREVQFDSRGGNVDEGLTIGRKLRSLNVTTRVPAGAMCVSICTAAFMGGARRIVEPGAQFRIHMFSRHGERMKAYEWEADRLKRLAPAEARPILLRMARREAQNAQQTTFRLLDYYYEMRQREGLRSPLLRELAARVLEPAESYGGGRDIEEDLVRVRVEGPVALQALLKEFELSGARHAVAQVRSELLAKDPNIYLAVEIVEASFNASIDNTAPLNEASLRAMGWVNVVGR